MYLKAVLNEIEGLKAKGNLDIDITGISHDSRKIEQGSMFIAIKGFETDGHKYIKEAIKNGAQVIMIEEGTSLKKSDLQDDTTVIMAPDTRIALAKIACNFYDNPSNKFNLIGITGTKGKTTTTFMIKSILEKYRTKGRFNRNNCKLYW
jgi:UDP-N-acetylmuramyl tripeptide synthase